MTGMVVLLCGMATGCMALDETSNATEGFDVQERVALEAPSQPAPQASGPVRGMYFAGVETLFSSQKAMDDLLQFIGRNRITYVLFYIRHHQVQSLGPELSDFINKVKSDYGVHEVGATTGPHSTVVADHNRQHSGTFDVINLENEYWGGNANETERATRFSGWIDALKSMRESAAGTNLKVEAYIGWPRDDEMARIVQNLDRLLVHTYVRDPNSAYKYGSGRFQMISDLNSDVEVMPIYSLAEFSELDKAHFMGVWTKEHSPEKADFDFRPALELAESLFIDEHNERVANDSDWKVNFVGAHYFIYGHLMDLPPTASASAPEITHLIVDDGSSPSVDFTVRAKDRNLAGVEWFQNGSIPIGSHTFGDGENTHTLTVSATPPYTVSAVPYDSGIYGNPGVHGDMPAEWRVVISNALPGGDRTDPTAETIDVKRGSSHRFVLEATDADGNLFAADWYMQGYKGRVYLSGDRQTVTKTIQFDELGTYQVSVDLFDRAVYLPANEVRQKKARSAVTWTISVAD